MAGLKFIVILLRVLRLTILFNYYKINEFDSRILLMLINVICLNLVGNVIMINYMSLIMRKLNCINQ